MRDNCREARSDEIFDAGAGAFQLVSYHMGIAYLMNNETDLMDHLVRVHSPATDDDVGMVRLVACFSGPGNLLFMIARSLVK